MSENTTPTQNGIDATTDDDRPTCPNGSPFCANTPGLDADEELECWLCFDTTGLADEEEEA